MQQAKPVESGACPPSRSRAQLAIGVFFLLLGVAIVVKATLTDRDIVSYVLAAFLIVSGALRLAGKST